MTKKQFDALLFFIAVCTVCLIAVISIYSHELSNKVDSLRPECEGQTSSINAQGEKHTEWFPKGCQH